MRAEYAQKPLSFSTLPVPGNSLEVVIRDNIEESVRPATEATDNEQVKFWTADEYIVIVPGRPDIEADIEANFPAWVAAVKAQALAEVKAKKLTEVSQSCTAAIYAGLDVALTDDKEPEHFSLTEKDQINITQAVLSVRAGMEAFPYHSDGNICRMFSAAEILLLGEAATAYVLYHTTLCNHLNTWIRRCESDVEVSAITYCAPLPEDLAQSLAAIVGVQA